MRSTKKKEKVSIFPPYSKDIAKSIMGKIEAIIGEDACVDEYHTDQLLIFMTLANGTSKMKVKTISLHT
jgi:RNA 3'-terminal phosphate cyclase